MSLKFIIGSVMVLLIVSSCASVSSSKPLAPVTGPAWTGRVFISQASFPSEIEYEVIGTVKANARAGYDRAESLYPLLAEEARKIGANAIINAIGGRRVAAYSWAAAYVEGTAVKVNDPDQMKGLSGSYY